MSGGQVEIKSVSNEEYGLEMAIFTGVDDSKKSYLYERQEKGAVVIIDDQETISIDKEDILIEPRMLTNVLLQRTHTVNLPKPYNDCYDQDSTPTELIKQMLLLNMTYDRRNCFTLCRQKKLLEALGCYDVRYPRIYNATPCKDIISFRRFDTIDIDLNECMIQCPFECETKTYNWLITYADYPSYRQFKLLNGSNYDLLEKYFPNKTFTYQDLKMACTSFFIYFDPIAVTEISQSPSITLGDLISNIGGNLGLFIGLSLLSFFELFELFAYAIEAVIR